MAQIRWTSREWRVIADKLVQRAVIPSEHGWRGHLRDAMQVALPKERWREMHSLGNAKEILMPLMKEVLREPPKPEGPLVFTPSIEGFTSEQLLQELVRRAVSGVMEQVREQLRTLTVKEAFVSQRRHDPHGTSAARPARPARPGVLVVGPRNGQQQELIAAHPDLSLWFVSSEENPAQVTARGTFCDHVVLWTNFWNHQH